MLLSAGPRARREGEGRVSDEKFNGQFCLLVAILDVLATRNSTNNY